MVENAIIVKAQAWLGMHTGVALSLAAQNDILEQLKHSITKLSDIAQAEADVLGWRSLSFDRLIIGRSRSSEASRYYLGLTRRYLNIFKKWKTSNHLLVENWMGKNQQHAPIDTYGQITRILPYEAETHDGGAIAKILIVENGQKIIFKPKSASTDLFLIHLLECLNKIGISCFQVPPTQPTLTGLIQLYLESDETTVEPFKFGQVAAVLYFLRGTDFHCENIITRSGVIYLIDTETIFTVDGRELDYFTPFDTGILPSPVIDGGGNSYDFSPVAQFIRENAKLHPEKNLDDVVNGFSDTLNKLLNNKDLLVGVICKYLRAKDVVIRVIPRSTLGYIYAIKRMPVKIFGSKERETLARKILETSSSGFTDLFDYEVASIASYEVPAFRVRMNDGSLFYQAQLIGTTEPPLVRWKTHVDNINKKSVDHMIGLLNDWTKPHRNDRTTTIPLPSTHLHLPNSSSYRLCRAAVKLLYKRLSSIAEREVDSGDYYAAFPVSSTEHRLLKNNIGLYNGWIGFGLFSVQYGRVFDDYRAVALGDRIITECCEIANKMKSIDLAMGRSGLLLAYKNIESSNSHTSQINEIVNYITSGKHDNFAQTVGYDFLGGESGVLFALSRVLTETTYRITPDFENWMRNRTDVMLERLKDLPATPLGMAHGTSGWIFSLSHIYRTGILTGIEQKLIETVVEIINHQDRHFHPQKGWPDLRSRKISNGNNYLANWCSGAAGIGLARISMLQSLHSLIPAETCERVSTSIENAIICIKNSSFGSLDFCCGEAGKIDFLLHAGHIGYRVAVLAAQERSTEMAARLFENGIG